MIEQRFCPHCGSNRVYEGTTLGPSGNSTYYCKDCGKKITPLEVGPKMRKTKFSVLLESTLSLEEIRAIRQALELRRNKGNLELALIERFQKIEEHFAGIETEFNIGEDK